jgi:hypothetical protein
MQNHAHDEPVDFYSVSESILIDVANSVFIWKFVEWILLTELSALLLFPGATGSTRDRKANHFDISEELECVLSAE